MSKLTKSIREAMARKLVQYRYTDEAKRLVRDNDTLAERAYNHCYPEDLLEHMRAVAKVYPGAFYEHHSFIANAGGFVVHLGGSLHSKWVTFQQTARKTWWVAGTSWNAHHNLTDEKLIADVKTFASDLKNFSDTCSMAYHEALSVLNTITTGKKLAEAWPEAMPVIGDLIPEGERTLPVVQVSAINAKFKLPPKEKKGGKAK